MRTRPIFLTLVAASLAVNAAQGGVPAGQAFTYQGRLEDAGRAADGVYSLRFTLLDAQKAGQVVGKPVVVDAVEVENGLFTLELDFGSRAFDGSARFLEIAVRPATGNGEYVTLEPRQALRPAPYALMALGTQAGSTSGSPEPRGAGDHWGEAWTGAGTGLILQSTALDGYGLWGLTAGTSGAGVYGRATSPSASNGWATGVIGYDQSQGGDPNDPPHPNHAAGVLGHAKSSTGLTIGVQGITATASRMGIGVVGYAVLPGAPLYGVEGVSAAPHGRGVYGVAEAATGSTCGVSGDSRSPSGTGVKGVNAEAAGPTNGIWGEARSDAGTGVKGMATAETGTTYGVHGESRSQAGIGVHGRATAPSGSTSGVLGQSDSPIGTAMRGSAPLFGVYAQSTATSGVGYGVYAVATSTSSATIFANAPKASGVTYGVWAQNNSNGGTGVFGVANSASGTTYGVQGHAVSPNGRAVYAYNSSSGVGLHARSTAGNLIEAYGSNAADLEFKVENDGDVFADGTYHALGADFAELLPAELGLEPGDVLAVDRDGRLTRSGVAFQISAVGVYSTLPALLGGSGDRDSTGKVPLAVRGVVPVKVSAENGPIRPGDLIVASSVSGHAMAAGKNPPQGSVLGKALQELDRGTGVIRMLVSLQ